MPAKLFIVERGNEALFRTLSTVLRNELDVQVIYNRRVRDQKELRPAVERRVRTDVEQRLRAEGYAVVRLSSDDTLGGNVRWS
jgi:hypothetical protein